MNGKVKCELLNVRKTPEKADNIVATVTKGTELMIIDDANGWLRVHADNLDGYVMAEFVAIEAAPAAQNPEKPKKRRKKGGEEDEQTGTTG